MQPSDKEIVFNEASDPSASVYGTYNEDYLRFLGSHYPQQAKKLVVHTNCFSAPMRDITPTVSCAMIIDA